MEAKRIYLDERSERAAEVIIDAGYCSSVSAAVRTALVQFAAALPAIPRMTPTTPHP